ncbi:MAG: cell envelope integrity protein TolA, partial [Gammaproteobacteria bacterium]
QQELKKKQEEKERQQRIAELQKQIEMEEAERKKQAKRAAQQKEVDRYTVLIKQAISKKWRVPISAKKGQECVLRLRLIPSGEVVSVEVVKSSGDTVYDRSVEAAVYKASPLPLPPAESGLFNEFREINVPFRLESRNI